MIDLGNITIQELDEAIKTIFNTPADRGVYYGCRRLQKGHPGKCINSFSSHKNQGILQCESRLEHDNCLHLEFDKNVVTFRVQPFKLQIGNKESYTADSIHINHFGLPFVREVKVESKLSDQTLIDRLNRIGHIFREQAIGFEVVTEKTLQTRPQINNLKYLYRASHIEFESFQIQQAIDVLRNFGGSVKLREFRAELTRKCLHPIIAEKILFMQLAGFDQSKLITPDSPVWVKGGEL